MRKIMRSRLQLAMLVLAVTGLSACAEDPNAHYYHSRKHVGQTTPNWYRPPVTPQNTFHYQKPTRHNGEVLKYDQ
ncbi:hypothetical protein [Acetobacter syzygii]|nr:hypothetical protein [Acetobacter syzygii]NSL91985.1 hypothetical protein [Acetobacter syzygii]